MRGSEPLDDGQLGRPVGLGQRRDAALMVSQPLAGPIDAAL
jgi:hypothetical protein